MQYMWQDQDCAWQWTCSIMQHSMGLLDCNLARP